MNKTAIANWSELEPQTPAYALIANVDLVVVRWKDDHLGTAEGRCMQGLPHGARERVGPAAANEDDPVPPEVRSSELGGVQLLRAPVAVPHSAQCRAFGEQEPVHAREAEEQNAGPSGEEHPG